MQAGGTRPDTMRPARVFATVVGCALLGAAAVVVAMFASALGSVSDWAALLRVSALFALFGAQLGTIIALDRKAPSPFHKWFGVPLDAPVFRTALCSALGAAEVAVVWSWSPDVFSLGWCAAGAGFGAILGWSGWRWAQYIDF